MWHCYEIATSLPLKSDCRLEIGPRSLCDWWRRKVCSRRSFRFIMVVEYEPLDELIATPPFTRCACYYRYPRLPSYALPGCKVTPIEPLKLIYPNSTLASLARQIQSSRA